MTDRLPALLATVALLLGGVVEADNEGLSAALFSAGFIVLGAWLAMEVRHHRQRKESDGGTA